MGKNDGEQHAGVFHRQEAVRHTTAQDEQLPGLQSLHTLGRFEVEHAFEATDCVLKASPPDCRRLAISPDARWCRAMVGSSLAWRATNIARCTREVSDFCRWQIPGLPGSRVPTRKRLCW